MKITDKRCRAFSLGWKSHLEQDLKAKRKSSKELTTYVKNNNQPALLSPYINQVMVLQNNQDPLLTYQLELSTQTQTRSQHTKGWSQD